MTNRGVRVGENVVRTCLEVSSLFDTWLWLSCFCSGNLCLIGKALLYVKSCDNHVIDLAELSGAGASTP